MLVRILLFLTLITTIHADDQFVQVMNPGWTNSSQYSMSGAWGDYDKDGFIDLFVANCALNLGSWANFLYHNNGDGTFTQKTAAEVGLIASDEDPSDGGYWCDVNNDGLLDLVVLNFIDSPNSSLIVNRLYLNSGKGTFISAEAGDLTQPSATFGWGGLADFDNDGWLDVFACTAWTANGYLTNLLFHGQIDGTFGLVTNGVVVTDEITSSFSNDAAWSDFDNDGDLDLIVANYQNGGDFFYRNDGHGQFTRMTNSILEQPGYRTLHHAWGDYDNDGFLDLFVTETTGNNALYHNLGNTNHWIKFQLEGTMANRSAIGTKVRVKATIGGKMVWQMREVGGDNFCQNDFRPNFGLGNATKVDLVRIEWPSGVMQELSNLPANQILHVTEPSRLTAQGPGQVQIRSWKSMRFEVQASTDLVNWTPACMVTNLDGTLKYVDPSATSHAQRFYRALAK